MALWPHGDKKVYLIDFEMELVDIYVTQHWHDIVNMCDPPSPLLSWSDLLQSYDSSEEQESDRPHLSPGALLWAAAMSRQAAEEGERVKKDKLKWSLDFM